MNDKKFNKQSENFIYWERKASEAIGDDFTDRLENDEVCISMTNDKFMRDIFNFKILSADYSA